MISNSSLLLKKVGFSFLLLTYLSSPLLAMEGGEDERRSAAVTPSSPSRLGKAVDWSVLTGCTIVGYYVGKICGQPMEALIAQPFEDSPTWYAIDSEKYLIWKKYVDRWSWQQEDKFLTQAFTPHWGSPYEELPPLLGATIGYLTGKGIVSLNHWTIHKISEWYPSALDCMGRALSWVGEKLTWQGENIRTKKEL